MGILQARILEWVGCHAILQRIFPTQKLNQGLLHCRQILYQLSYQGSPLLCILYSYFHSRTDKTDGIIISSFFLVLSDTESLFPNGNDRNFWSCLREEIRDFLLGFWYFRSCFEGQLPSEGADKDSALMVSLSVGSWKRSQSWGEYDLWETRGEDQAETE